MLLNRASNYEVLIWVADRGNGRKKGACAGNG